jgi:NAD-dependent SIR2 family protein deacetylase
VVWFGNVGGISSEVEPYADVAEAFVRQARSSLKGLSKIPRLAVNVLGTGDGGMHRSKGTMIQELVKRLTALTDELPVDVVLVTWGVKQYAAAQRARKRLAHRALSLEGEIDAPNPAALSRTISELAERVRRQQLVLFAGAGVSTGAGLPLWQELLDGLARTAPEHPDGPLDLERLHKLDVRDQAQVLARRYGQKDYKAWILERFQSDHYALAHGLLASLDPHEVVTTNYDNLMEKAFGHARRQAVLPREAVGPDGRWILKLHGSLDELDSVVLTREEYLGLPERSQALFGIVQAMLITKHMLFVGYSLSDDSFHRIIHQVRRARGQQAGGQKIGTVLTLFDDPLLRELWGDDLDVVGVARRPTVTLGDAEEEALVREASRSLDIVLDRVALEAADVTAFLLDQSYEDMLDTSEMALRQELLELVDQLEHGGPIGLQIEAMLSTMLRDDPKDADPHFALRRLSNRADRPSMRRADGRGGQ